MPGCSQEVTIKSKVVPLLIPENLDDLTTLCSQEQRTDKATALCQWLYQGAEGYVLKLVKEGRISVGCAAELLYVNICDIIAQDKGIRLGAAEEQYQRSREVAARLMSRLEQEAKE